MRRVESRGYDQLQGDYLRRGNRTESYPAASSSLAEARKELARQREQELIAHARSGFSSSGEEGERRRTRQQRHAEPVYPSYQDIRERKLADEKLYHGEAFENAPQQHLKHRQSHDHRVQFEDERNAFRGRQGSGWDDDETGLVQWARERARLRPQNEPVRSRAPTPPTYQSPPSKQNDGIEEVLRSISAPVFPAGGIATLGQRVVTESAKKSQQRKYAEELQAQIREKNEAKRKERTSSQAQCVREQKTHVMHSASEAPHHPTVNGLSTRDAGKPHRMEGPERSFKQHTEEHHSSGGRFPYTQQAFPGPGQYYPGPHQPYPPSYAPSTYYNTQWGPPPPPHSFHYLHYPPPPMPQHPRHADPYYNPYYPPHPLYGEPQHQGMPQQRKEMDSLSYKDGLNESEEYSLPSSNSTDVKKLDKDRYRNELKMQMQEKRERESKSRLEKEQYERGREAEIEGYNPWGKGGGGAPVRDMQGRLVADLRKMRRINNDRLINKNSPVPPHSSDGGRVVDTSPAKHSMHHSPRQDSSPYSYTPAVTEDEFKRKTQLEYRDFLKQQVEEKEAEKKRQEEIIKMEEQKELDRIKREQVKLKEDYAKEQEMIRQREEEAKRKNMALQAELEKKRQEEAQRMKEEEMKELERERRANEHKRAEPVLTYQPRSVSPPVPTVAHRQEMRAQPLPKTSVAAAVPHNSSYWRSKSPPVPALQHKMVTQTPLLPSPPPVEAVPFRTTSPPVPAVVKKLKAERKKATTGEPAPAPSSLPLQEQTNSEAQGPSVAREPLPPPALDRRPLGHVSRPTCDPTQENKPILEKLSELKNHLQRKKERAMWSVGKSEAIPAHGTTAGPPQGPTSKAIEDFKMQIKYGHPIKPRLDLQRHFPRAPDSESALEVQQDFLLNRQEEELDRLRGRNGRRTLFPSSHVSRHFGAEELFPKGRVEQKQLYPWERKASSNRIPSADAVSVSTIGVDDIAARNEDRVRRLEAILNADISADPGSSLQALMAGNSSTRAGLESRSSEQSLECETTFHSHPIIH